MYTIAPIELMVLCFAAALFVWAATTDYRSFKIPNRISISLVALYPAYLLAGRTMPSWEFIGIAVAFALIVFIVGFGMFVMGWMGGGDVKLLSVAALWAGPAVILPFLIVVVAASMVLALVIAVRTLTEQSVPLREAVVGLRFAPLMKLTVPYGAAIAVGGLYVVGRIAVTA
jgi:prepilin peptidase CpaA